MREEFEGVDEFEGVEGVAEVEGFQGHAPSVP